MHRPASIRVPTMEGHLRSNVVDRRLPVGRRDKLSAQLFRDGQ